MYVEDWGGHRLLVSPLAASEPVHRGDNGTMLSLVCNLAAVLPPLTSFTLAFLVQCAEGAVASTMSVNTEDVYFVGNGPFAHLADGSDGAGAEGDAPSSYKV